MASNPENLSEDRLSEMNETISSLQTELEKVKLELSEIKAGKPEKLPEEEPEEEIPEPEPVDEDTKEMVIEHLKKIPGIGLVMAEKIYDAGFTSRDQLKEVKVEELTEIPGIGPSMANKIVENLKRIEEGKDIESAAKEPEEPKPEGPGITDKAMDFIKGTVSKIKGFLIKSPPEKKVEEEPKEEKKEPEQSVEVSGAPAEEESKSADYPSSTKDEVIEAYSKVDGIDTELATKLYEAGYGSMNELKEAEPEDLVLIEGISKDQSEQICEGLKNT
jgi:DNA uptake protein ComE-like DNA-binding protein